MEEIRQGRQWSLSTVATFWSALALAVAMGFYAVVEVAFLGRPLAESFLAHVAHVAILSVFILTAMAFVVYEKVTKPVARVNAYLYRLGAGDTLTPLPSSRVVELDQLSAGIYAMMGRMHAGRPGLARIEAEKALGDLKAIAGELQGARPEESAKILDAVMRLGACVASIQQITRK
ncbi:MAG: hypothetical protein AB1405_17090 [Bdellovibrionota bacterium]